MAAAKQLHRWQRPVAVGDVVRSTRGAVFDLLIMPGDHTGTVVAVEDGWVHATWPQGTRSVPQRSVRRVR